MLLRVFLHLKRRWHREEIEKQKAKERYMKMHLAGKTDQAKADLARLAIIKKQREEAAKKKEEEKKGDALGKHCCSSVMKTYKILFHLSQSNMFSRNYVLPT